jgi:hypothetical protein
VTITSAVIPAPPGKIPKEVSDALHKLEGSVLTFTVTDTGPADFRIAATSGLDSDYEAILPALEEVLSTIYILAPDKPIGENGYWIASDRHNSLGVDVLRYRVFRVRKVEGDVASIDIETKAYAVSAKLPESTDLGVVEFASSGEGRVDIGPDTIFGQALFMHTQTGAKIGKPNDDKHGKVRILDIQSLTQPLPKGVRLQGPGGPDDEPGPN